MAKQIKCPKCGKDIHRTVSSGATKMSGLSCSPCRIHFDIAVAKDGSYKVTSIR